MSRYITLLILVCGCARNEPANIAVNPPMNYVVLEQSDFDIEYHKAFETLDLKTEPEKQRFRDVITEVQDAVEAALGKKWKKPDDFEVGWDFNYCYHACGGIYSERVFCQDYVTTVHAALQTVDKRRVWTYHTVCEITTNPNAPTIGESIESWGEFFIRGDTCYVNGSDMKPEWRTRLGCPK